MDALIKWGGSETFRWKHSCHLYADSLEELHAFARLIGMKRSWFQNHKIVPHYDLNENRRIVAVQRGAIEHGRSEMVAFYRRSIQSANAVKSQPVTNAQ